LLSSPITSTAQEKITLQLKWTHAFQFAGYYAAKELGYYREAGLDVNILEAGSETDPISDVIQNKAQYGVGSSGLLLSRASGKAVIVLAVIFQQSPYEIYAAPEIHHLRDLIGKRLMLEPQSDELIAFLKKEGIPLDSVQMVPHSFSADGLLQGKTDAMSGYLSSEPYFFRQVNFPFQVFSPRSSGIDFYGDNLFTSEKELKNHPARVKAFRAASLRGWLYAKENRDKVIEMIFSKYSKIHSVDYLHFESDQMIPLLQPDLIDIGYMNPNRWKHIADTYSSIVQELPHELNVCADKSMIATILRNLVSNAVKFTNLGGTIVISAEQASDGPVITVADSGIGITPQALEKLFRIDQNISTKGTQNEMGTGLGLILCKEFIEKHNGRIWAESEFGNGSKFCFTLPIN
jgi:ABC-type nitrate/sulfonate/bicarbonate transport system substrate-binding protein